MVDNENQWDDIEYSNDNMEEYYDEKESGSNTDADFDTDNTNSEYSEEDYENNYEDDSDYEEQKNASSSKKSNLLPLLVIALLLLGVGGFFAVSKLSHNDTDKTASSNTSVEQEDSMFSSTNEDDPFFNQDTSSDMMSVDFNDSGDAQVKNEFDSDDTITTVKNSNEDNDLFAHTNDSLGEEKTKENNDIIISYDKTAARMNPFKPPFEDRKNALSSRYASLPNTEFEIIEPPTESVADINLEKLLKTQISGILYDDVSPSAIVNLNGVDTFVKAGDTIYGFTIDAITRNKVQITYRNNTYTAAVGELFTTGTIDKPTVANLEKKFAGRYK